ncbi:MAG: glycosyltransferase [Rhodospirillaceae bacterium]|nr:glycosyltransferase [Rhodospirillaceae bacterium]
MRVLQVMASGRHGGAELFYEDLVPALAKAGAEQVGVIRPYPDRAAILRQAGCRVTMLKFGGPLDLVTRFKLAKIARTEQPDIAMGWMNRACNDLPTGPWVNVGRLGGYYDLKYYRRCTQLICNTPDICDYVVRAGRKADAVHYIPNFCPVRDEPPVDRALLGGEAAPVLLILARLHPAKGIDVALRALPEIKDAVLWIAGDGPDEAKLKRLTADLGLGNRVRFLGWRDDRSALLKAADVCLLPSRMEPFGNVVLNAWAHGVPLVASMSQGPGKLVQDGDDGLLVPVDNAGALAARVKAVLGDRALAKRLTAGGLRRTAAEFSESAVVERYLAIYRAFLA